MSGLASFDSLLARRRAALSASFTPSTQARPDPVQLLDPWGEPVAEFLRTPGESAVLKAAYRLAGDDWCGVLADEAASRGLDAGWRLALLRADRHGRPRLARDTGPQWLSPAVTARPGCRPAALLKELRAAAVAQLWRQGWRLVG